MARLLAHACVAALIAPSLAAGQAPDPWRARTAPLYGVRYAPDLGLVIGAGMIHTRYAFRALPPSTRIQLRAAYATSVRSGEVDLAAEFRRLLHPATLGLEARASGLETIRFYGVGNASDASGPDSIYELRQTQIVASPTVSLSPAPRVRLTMGPLLKHTSTRAGAATVFATTGPHYGDGDFERIGFGVSMELDKRDAPLAAAHGTQVSLAAAAYPSFVTLSAAASTFFSVADPAGITLALRAAAAAARGRVPVQDLVYVGGETSVRGYPEQRFAGRQGAFVNAELRLRAVHTGAGDMGVFGLADAGRVWVSGETSDRWHAAAGGGMWVAPRGRRAETISITLARSPERTGVYLRAGFLF